MGKLIEAIGNIFRIKDLRNRVLFTFAMLAVYRFGSYVPTPGIDVIRWDDFLTRQSGGVLGFFCGKKLATVLPQKIFDRFLLVCTTIGALRLIG